MKVWCSASGGAQLVELGVDDAGVHRLGDRDERGSRVRSATSGRPRLLGRPDQRAGQVVGVPAAQLDHQPGGADVGEVGDVARPGTPSSSGSATPVVRISSPPRSRPAMSASSLTCTQRTGAVQSVRARDDLRARPGASASSARTSATVGNTGW